MPEFCGIELEHPVVNASGTYDAIAARSGADARDFLTAGAALVAVGTESFRDPRAGARAANDLETGVSDAPPRVEALHLD
jgi:dihydroorotate dehydrogenase